VAVCMQRQNQEEATAARQNWEPVRSRQLASISSCLSRHTDAAVLHQKSAKARG